LAACWLRAQATVFVDDQPRNVEAARGLGFIALRFSSAARLRRDLQALGAA
jgi:FMN phosphatase YigB (HAD superfamily)